MQPGHRYLFGSEVMHMASVKSHICSVTQFNVYSNLSVILTLERIITKQPRADIWWVVNDICPSVLKDNRVWFLYFCCIFYLCKDLTPLLSTR